MSANFDFGLVGLGVMGRNFILNVLDHDFSAIGLDTDTSKTKALLKEGKGKKVDATTDAKEFISKLAKPRKIMLLVPAGGPVDSVINDLKPFLDKGDLIIDGGNSFFEDTDRREDQLSKEGIFFIGSGVSGGAKGARFGPSIMPGGDQKAYEVIKPIFEAVSAKVGEDQEPCVDYMGRRSAGNYVKMVHNGIEYGLMQLISECYHIMKKGFKLSNRAIGYSFSEWNQRRLQSFLIEITAEIFHFKDANSKFDLVDLILDKAKQKGTGKWTSQNAMDLGMPTPTIDAAVTMRGISSFKDDRTKLEQKYPKGDLPGSDHISLDDLENSLLFAFIITYAQGLSQLTTASSEYDYGLKLERICAIWRGGCIIRSVLLEDFRKVFDKDPDLKSILMNDDIASMLNDLQNSCRKVIQFAIDAHIPVMAYANCLSYFDSITTERLPSNLIQAQRDHFGSHTYERIDKEGIFHTEW